MVFKLSTHVIPVCVIAMKKAGEKTGMSYSDTSANEDNSFRNHIR